MTPNTSLMCYERDANAKLRLGVIRTIALKISRAMYKNREWQFHHGHVFWICLQRKARSTCNSEIYRRY